ncbi:MAG TPA: serine/threonine-protein kinase, partial [Bryobacteraceae bacterium]|nr:serine/threonine-protein kinase [Bryobacteraceae bacterium]
MLNSDADAVQRSGAAATPAAAPDPTATIGAAAENLPAGSIGPYRLIRQLGEGGMGIVYHAQQLEPIRRDVALKVIKPGMDSRQVIARFESERQALAMMDHPNIARVLEAGTTPTGLPYFVMELVDGIPITQFCDEKRLTIGERIDLFIPVCQAIQHAHQKGIIHRDIKPSNILVSRRENQTAPKVIDFGLAKALGRQLNEATMAMTTFGTVVGTLQYMSPEQAELGRDNVDTRTDIYSLGAVLYELLTGVTPLEPEQLTRALWTEALQQVRDQETKAPSVRLRRSGELKAIADRRQCEPSRLPKLLNRELDWIALKSLEKDRTRRYETVNGLARDLQRYLRGEPVEAAPPSAAYRMSKFVRRHRLGLATAAAFILLLISAVLVSAWMAVRARRAEAEARAVNDFLQDDVLAQASAYNQAGGDHNLTVRAALDRAAARIGGKFTGQPLVEASIRHTIGAAYVDLSLYSDAERHFRRALELRRRELGDRHPDTIATMASLAAVYERAGRYKDAERLYTQLVEVERRVLGNDAPNTLKTMNGLAVTYAEEGRFAESVKMLAEVVPAEQRVLGEENLQTLRAMGNLAAGYEVLGQRAKAEALALKTLELKRRALGADNPETLDTTANLAELYSNEGDYARAETLYVSAVDGYRRALGAGHLHAIASMGGLADVYRYRGKYKEAEAVCLEALQAARGGIGEEHPAALDAIQVLAETYDDQGRYDEAATLFRKLLEKRRRVLGGDHPDTIGAAML